ncbi:hypothetical protein SETIT_4G274600v2 [Setaria italica]|uniref:Uncharacterized protein n=1 Tax=Setaria italica TaxID=4555 RepID=A0A368QYX3_SETIT|nr:hypothetical protein SETIT_4G274600v2 [Setaria italica]
MRRAHPHAGVGASVDAGEGGGVAPVVAMVEGEEDLAERPPRDLAVVEEEEVHGELAAQRQVPPQHVQHGATTRHSRHTTPGFAATTTPCCCGCCCFPATIPCFCSSLPASLRSGFVGEYLKLSR